MPKRGVGIHFKTDGLTAEIFTEWCFQHVGDVQLRLDQIIVAANHERGEFFSFAPALNKLRIGVYGEIEQQAGWNAVIALADRLAVDNGVGLETIEHDLYENGTKIGHWTMPLAAPEIKSVGPVLPSDKTRWN